MVLPRIKLANSTIFLLIISFFAILYTSAISQSEEIADPDPLRFSQEIDEFYRWDAKNSFPEDAILFVGSSSIRLWETQSAFPEYPVINRGLIGAHISDILYFLDHIILKYSPSLIVLYCGDNDISFGKSVECVYRDYHELLDRIKSDLPEVEFVFLPIKPSMSRWSFYAKMDTVNHRIQEFNQQSPNLHFVDTGSLLLGENGLPDSTFFLSDQLHLNKRGYDAWNSKMRKFLQAHFAGEK